MTIYKNEVQIIRGYNSNRKLKIMKNDTHIAKVHYEFILKTNFSDESLVQFGLK